MEWNRCSILLFGYQKMESRKVPTPLFGNTKEGDNMERILVYLFSFHPILLKLDGRKIKLLDGMEWVLSNNIPLPFHSILF